MKKEIKIGSKKISFEIKKTTIKEKITAILVILVVAGIIYLIKR